MNFVATGSVSHMAYGAHVRGVEMTRGNRQGNNAFLHYSDNVKAVIAELTCCGAPIIRLVKQRLISVDMFKTLEKLCGESNPSAYGGDLK